MENSCQGSTRSFAQALAFARKGLKVSLALGTDFNGFIAQTRPRFGDLGACAAGFRAESDLTESAETFVRMWERATGTRTGIADAATDLDTTGVIPIAAKATREASYPTACGTSYAPASKAKGQNCRIDAECITGSCSAALCGALPGQCK